MTLPAPARLTMKTSPFLRCPRLAAALLLSLFAVATLSAAEGARRIEPDWFTRLGPAWVFNEGRGDNPGGGSFQPIRLPGSGKPAGRLSYDFTAIKGGAYVGALLTQKEGLRVDGPFAEIRLTASRSTPGVLLLRLIDSNRKTFQYKLQHTGAGIATDYKVDVRRPNQMWGGPAGAAKDDRTIAWPLLGVFLGVETPKGITDAGEAVFWDVELLTAD